MRLFLFLESMDCLDQLSGSVGGPAPDSRDPDHFNVFAINWDFECVTHE